MLAFYVRTKEILLANFINHFLLAEQCYADEIKFIKRRFTIVENKYLTVKNGPKKELQIEAEFLISGTISTEYGVFDGVHFFKQLDSSKHKLIIIGHCPNKRTFEKLTKEVKNEENVELLISTSPIPHRDILSHIGAKTIGLLPYQTNKSTESKIPTKLYEYIGLHIQVLISPNPIWSDIIDNYHAGLSIDFQAPIKIDDLSISLELIKDRQHLDLKNIMWKSEEVKLLTVTKSLLS